MNLVKLAAEKADLWGMDKRVHTPGTHAELLPSYLAGLGTWDENPDEPEMSGYPIYHVARTLVTHGFTVLDPSDYAGRFGVTVEEIDEEHSPWGHQVAVIWRVPELGRVDPAAGRLNRFRQCHRQDADRVRDAIFNIFNSAELGFAAERDPANPGVILVSC